MQPGSKEWLEFRRKKIGASDAARICGVTPKSWGSVKDLWQEKMGLKETKDSLVMEMGRMMEEEARIAYEKLASIDVFPVVVMHGEHDWLMATMDGLTLDRDIGVEIKTGEKTYKLAKDGIIPDYYNIQMQVQMEVCDLESIDYFVWRPNREPFLKRVNRDRALFAEMLPKLEAFWICLKDNVPPGSEEETILFQASEDFALQFRYEVLKKRLDDAQSEMEYLREEILQKAAGRPAQIGNLKITRRTAKGCIQWKNVPQKLSEELDQYRGPSKETWCLELT